MKIICYVEGCNEGRLSGSSYCREHKKLKSREYHRNRSALLKELKQSLDVVHLPSSILEEKPKKKTTYFTYSFPLNRWGHDSGVLTIPREMEKDEADYISRYINFMMENVPRPESAP